MGIRLFATDVFIIIAIKSNDILQLCYEKNYYTI